MVKLNLSDIVAEFMDEQERLSPHQKPRFMRIAKRGLEELHWDIAGDPFNIILKVDKTNNTAPLPDNFIKEVGVYYTEGEQLVILSRNENLVKAVDDCGDLVNPTNRYGTWRNTYSPSTITKSNQFAGGLYGEGGRSNWGEYTIDFHTGLIFISTGLDKDEIYLRYLGSPIETKGDIKVHPFLREPIKKYLYWKMVDMKDSVPAGEKQYRFDAYENAKLWAANQISSIGKDEQFDLNRRNFTLAPKL